MIETSRKVLELAKNFSKIYPNLTNLKKFNKFEYEQEKSYRQKQEWLWLERVF